MKPITNTFVLIAADCPATTAVVPAAKNGRVTIASVQYELLTSRPYELTLEDLILATHAGRFGLSAAEAEAVRADLFAKPHPCMRASPLPKRYGWGVHHDAHGRIALHAAESPEYQEYATGNGVTVVPAMRTKRASAP